MVSDADFQSVATSGMDAPRAADGSLPVLPNFHLAAGSDLIDAGTDLKFPFAGKAPDLGAFEVGAAPPGGLAGAGGSSGAASGGSAATNGGAASGGSANGGGVNGLGGFFGNDGGSVNSGGAVTVTGGAVATGGTANIGTGGGAGPTSPAPAGSSGNVSTPEENGGCGCRFTQAERRSPAALGLLSFALCWLLRRRREG
jgi:MYXO-CTERM domain-containing protein